MLFTMRAMRTYPSAQRLGFFDEELRVQWIEATGIREAVGCGDRLGEVPPALGAGPGQTD